MKLFSEYIQSEIKNLENFSAMLWDTDEERILEKGVSRTAILGFCDSDIRSFAKSIMNLNSNDEDFFLLNISGSEVARYPEIDNSNYHKIYFVDNIDAKEIIKKVQTNEAAKKVMRNFNGTYANIIFEYLIPF